jgi:hypothetical protein
MKQLGFLAHTRPAWTNSPWDHHLENKESKMDQRCGWSGTLLWKDEALSSNPSPITYLCSYTLSIYHLSYTWSTHILAFFKDKYMEENYNPTIKSPYSKGPLCRPAILLCGLHAVQSLIGLKSTRAQFTEPFSGEAGKGYLILEWQLALVERRGWVLQVRIQGIGQARGVSWPTAGFTSTWLEHILTPKKTSMKSKSYFPSLPFFQIMKTEVIMLKHWVPLVIISNFIHREIHELLFLCFKRNVNLAL